MINEIIQNFSTQIQSGQGSLILVFGSFLGGVIASLSPCTLGILPIIIGYVGGYDKDKSPIKTLIRLLSFVIGLSAILTVIGIVCALTGRVFIAVGGQYFILIMASLIMIFGLNLLGVVEIPVPNIVKKMPKSDNGSLFVYPFIVGVLFALAATPCSTPILASIMSFASLSKNVLYASLFLFAFSLGQGLIIILAGIFTSLIKKMRFMGEKSEILMKICGVLLILASLYIFYNVFSQFLK